MNQGEFDDLLKENSDPKYLSFLSPLVPGHGKMHGVRMPVLKKIAKNICKGDWETFLALRPKSYEQQMVDALIIAQAEMNDSERMRYARSFVPTVGNWAVCDTFCATWRKPLDEMWEYCLELIGSGEEYRMRAAVVMMLSRFMDDGHIDGMLDAIRGHDHPGHYYRMGAAWALSACYVRYPEKAEMAMFSGDLPRETLRMAVGKICDSYRVPDTDKERVRERYRISPS